MEGLAEALASGIMVMGIIIIVFIISKYHYLTRKAMFEHGISKNSKPRTTQILEIGAVILGFGFGLIISTFYTMMELSEDAMDLLVWGTILIFGGLGLILAHLLRRKFDE